MKRKEKPKMVRRMPARNKFHFKVPAGGMTPYPPPDCPAPRVLVDEDGVRWADCYFCCVLCRPRYCTENREYHKYINRNKNKAKEKEAENETTN